MRKVLSFVLVLSLVLGSFSMAFAVAPADVVGEPSEEAVTVLSDLGVVSGYEDGTYKPENIVTRAEMAVLVIRALGLTDYVTTAAKSSFSDMSGYGWAEGYIAYAQSLGFVSGYPDGTFKPGRTVSYDEAASMLVRALGHTPESLVGTWPANFVVKAKALKILDGIQAGAAGANRGDVAIMLYQTLALEIGTVNKEGEWKSNNKTTDVTLNDTMLSRLGANVADVKVIKGDDVDKAKVNISKYLGAYAVTYTKDSKIIAVGEVKSTFLTGDYDSSEDTLTVGDVEYTLASTAGITASGIVIANGADSAAGAVTMNTYDGQTVTVAAKLSGKTITDVYSVARWTENWNGKFTADDAADIKDTKSLGGVKFALDDDKAIDTKSFDLVGVTSLDKIEKDNVVYVYKNNTTGKISRVAVGTEVITGEVTRIKDADITIGGKVYNMTTMLQNGVPTAPNTGNVVKAYLDAYGYIYSFKVTEGVADNYAVVLGTEDGSTTKLIGGEPQVKLFLADGTSKIYAVDKEATVDGNEMFSTLAWTDTTAAAIAGAGTIVKYNVNKDGDIDAFVTTTGKTVATAAASKLSKAGYYEATEIAQDAVIFTVNVATNGALGTASNYGVTKLDNVLDTSNVVAAYAKDSNLIEAMLIFEYSSTKDNVYAVFTEKASVSGDYKFELTGFVGKKEVTYNTDTDFNLVSGGHDLYKLVFDADGGLRSSSFSPVSATTTVAVTTTGTAVNGYTVTGGNTDVTLTLDKNVVVYVTDGTVLTTGSIRDIAIASGSALVVHLFDTNSTPDGLYDIVIVK